MVASAGCALRAEATLSSEQRADLKSEIKADAQAAVGALVDQSRNQTWNEIRPWIIGACIIATLLIGERIVERISASRTERARIAAERDEDVAQANHCHGTDRTDGTDSSTGAK